MERYSQRYDKHGFPIPVTFEDPGQPASQPDIQGGSAKPPVAEPLDDDATDERRRAERRLRVMGLLMVVVFLVGLGSLYGPPWLGRMLAAWGQESFQRGDVASAVTYLDYALWFEPEQPDAHLVRGWAHKSKKRFHEALADFDEAIRLGNSRDPRAYRARLHTLQTLAFHEPEHAESLHRRALRDADHLVGLVGVVDEHNSLERQRLGAELLNTRAYVRAVGGLQLPEALADSERSLATLERVYGRERLRQLNPPPGQYESLLAAKSYAYYLDTRGFILFQLDRFDEALADFELSLEIVNLVEPLEMQAMQRNPRLRAFSYSAAQEWRDSRAVMHHHRGQVLEALGRDREAQVDFDLAREYGYHPAGGVF